MSTISTMTSDELIENFQFLESKDDIYTYVIELGNLLPPFDDSLKNDQNKVEGCTAQVWMVIEDTNTDSFSFIADSDAHIVRGLIAILMIAYNGKALQDIQKFDIHNYFELLGLSSQLSVNRRHGFFAMVERIKSFSKAG